MPARRTVARRRRRLIEALAAHQGTMTDAVFVATVVVGWDEEGERVYLTATQWSRLKRGVARLTWEVAEGLARAYPDFEGELFRDFRFGLVVAG